MKKIIAAAAGLMLVGTMASAAFAAPGVTWKGNARVRYYYQENYAGTSKAAPVESKDTHWASRVRFEFKAEAKGGAYAVGRFRLADAKWDGTQQSAKGGEKTNLWVDKGYIGVPMGPIVVEGGMGYNTLPPFFRQDIDTDFLRAKFASDTTTIVPFFEKWDEYNEVNVTTLDALGVATTKTVIDNNGTTDDDVDLYGINLVQKFGGSWVATGTFAIADNQQVDSKAPIKTNDGFLADVLITGAAGGVGLAGELAYKAADVQGTVDDGVGGYVGANVPIGPASISGVLGFTKDGYVASSDFGPDDGIYAPFVLLSGYSPISTGLLIGTGGDTIFANVAPRFQATEQLSFMMEFTYADIDQADISVWELGGKASYAISDGAALHAYVGYLDIENADENPVGAGLSLEISY
jgi:hypothetical protein